MKKGINRRVLIITILIACTLAYLIMNSSKKTIKAAYNIFEDKINFKGFYFVDEYVLYKGDTREIEKKYKSGDLVSKDTRISNDITADKAGMIITHIDGYENKYNLKNIKSITPKEINSIVLNTKNSPGIKIVNSSQWYVCALLDKNDENYFKKGMVRDVNINNKYYTADIISALRNNNSVILIFRFKNDLDVNNLNRAIKGYVIKSKYNGINVPQKSIIDYNGSKGVYININGYAEFRKVKVLSIINGNAIVIPEEKSEPELMEYDEIICNPDGLENGKKI